MAAANRNCVESFRKLAQHCAEGEVREFGTAVAFVTGIPISLFNGCLAMGATAAETVMALDWVSRRGLPHLLWTDGEGATSDLADVARSRGLVAQPWAMPGMVLVPPGEPPPTPSGIRIEPVHGASLENWYAVMADNGMPRDWAERLFSPSFATDPDVALFTAHLDHVPVGTSIAIRSGNVSGVYGVATAKSARRRGVGTAATWAALNVARRWGCDLVTLQATEMAFPGYTKMGFETVVRYTTFVAA